MSHQFAVLNGRFVPLDSLTLPVTDPGVSHGAIVTDVCRTYGGRLFRHADHLQRFLRDCARCFIEIPYSPAQITSWARELVERNARSGDLLLNTFATPLTLVLRTVPLDVRRYADGVRLWPTPPHPAASGLLPPTVKHRNRFHWYIAERMAPPDTLALTTDADGPLLETAVGNLLMVRDGTVHSAPADAVLDGITLRVVRELCDRERIPFVHQPLTPEADEAVLCGTAFGLAGVREIDDRHYPCPGPLTRRLMAAWDALHTSSDNPTELLA
jgi:branched-subunit amino acid aminotransferase/4-amino-4-deoxychorismate lyase